MNKKSYWNKKIFHIISKRLMELGIGLTPDELTKDIPAREMRVVLKIAGYLLNDPGIDGHSKILLKKFRKSSCHPNRLVAFGHECRQCYYNNKKKQSRMNDKK